MRATEARSESDCPAVIVWQSGAGQVVRCSVAQVPNWVVREEDAGRESDASRSMRKRFGKTEHRQTQTAIHVCCPGEQGTPIVCEGALKHEFGKTGRYGRKLRGGRWLITSRNCIPLKHSKRDARGQGVRHVRPFEDIWNSAPQGLPPYFTTKNKCVVNCEKLVI